MSKDEEYQRRWGSCVANASKAQLPELSDIWQTLADAYAFLITLEADPEARAGSAYESSGERRVA